MEVEKTKIVPDVFHMINTVTQHSRAKIFKLISHQRMTFADLLDETRMSKSSLSANILELTKLGVIFVKPSRVEPTFYSLSPLGKRVDRYLHSLEDFLFAVPIRIENIAMDNEGFMELFEKNDVDDVKLQFKGKKFIIPLKSYVRIADWLDEKIVVEEHPEKFLQIEEFLKDEEFVLIVENYDDLSRSLDTEYYMRRQKKLTPEQAELVAMAEDQNAVIVSPHNKVINASTCVGLQAFDLDNFLSYLRIERTYRFGEATEQETSKFSPVVGQEETLEIEPKNIFAGAPTSHSRVKYKMANVGRRYRMTTTVTQA